jgi:hypothetical protein
MTSFAERVGGVLVSPRATLAHAATAGDGLFDVALLLGLKVAASETVALGRAILAVPALGAASLLRGLVHAISAVTFDVAAILVAAMAMRLFTRRGGPARELDLAAYAWVPYLAVTLVVWLVDTALGRSPGVVEATVARVLALGWASAAWLLGLLALRAVPPAPGDGAVR